MNPEQNNLNPNIAGTPQPMPGVQPQAVPVAGPMPGAQPQAVPVAGTMPGAQPQAVPVAGTMPAVQPQTVPVATPMPTVQPQAVPVATPMPGAQPQAIPVATPMPGAQPQMPQVPTVQTSTEDQELLKAFIGKNYDNITTGKFNIGAFFFSSLYLCYRKMFLYGLLLFIVTLIILNFINIPALGTAINVLLAIFFNKFYVKEANKRVQKIKQKNPDKSFEQLKEICTKKGGTSFGLATLGCFVNILITFLVLILLMILGLASLFNELLKLEITPSNSEEIVEEGSQSSFNGVISYDTSVNMKDNYTIVVPAEYTDESEDYSYDFTYETANTGIFNECSVSLKAVSGYTSGETLITQMYNYYNENSENATQVTTDTRNGITWKTFTEETSISKTHHYGTTKNNKAYLLTFEFQSDTNDACVPHIEQVLNTIQEK